MGMVLAGHQVGPIFAESLRDPVAHGAAMVQKKLKQVQIRTHELVAQCEIVAEPRIQVFHQGAASGRLCDGLRHGVEDGVELAAQPGAQPVPALPVRGHPLIIKEGLLVGFFLAGFVVLGGIQQWWLQPVVSTLGPTSLFFGALGLTAITDNAALTYLGSLIVGMTDQLKYMLVAGAGAGAVAGGGLTVIANVPNPAGVALLRRGFNDESIWAVGLMLGALPSTFVLRCYFFSNKQSETRAKQGVHF